ncbi:GTP 3',8-cyclase MoaA [Thalassotalea sp. LPB0316]|uniref:GTP 3',8-cyclase MoaA n=1 Tax=Thalassotalea sp. LPB0316 TaxID=2769490 RepID=UPI0018681C1F|nr:GTP 3',8-cyclase MoaA [Thalassotalea sp. LPB0316]QOL25734.1 GTP 3',8-cyclase MoaA [Thalassotalea sp. LPB0316]
MLTDDFGRRFYYLRLSITDVCNFRCEYCLPDGYQCDTDRQFLSLEEIKRTVNAFALMGTEKVRITGGEPSLRKDLPDIINAVANTNKIQTVALTTNGYKLTSQYQDWLDAGLNALNISIDSLIPEQFNLITGSNKLGEILTGIDGVLADGRAKLKVNAVLLKQYHKQQLDYFFDWVKETPVSVRFIELMETGDNKAYFEKQHISGTTIQNQLFERGWVPVIKEKSAGPAIEYCHSDYQGKIGLIMPYSKDFCASCNRLRMSALGKLHLCLFAEQGLSLREYLQEDDPTPLINAVSQLIHDKKATHFLHERLTGATSHLSMLGG